MLENEPTAADVHGRMIQDRRGEMFATLQCVNHATGRATRIILRHSVKGRADQYDMTINGKPASHPVGMVDVMKKWRCSIAQ